MIDVNNHQVGSRSTIGYTRKAAPLSFIGGKSVAGKSNNS